MLDKRQPGCPLFGQLYCLPQGAGYVRPERKHRAPRPGPAHLVGQDISGGTGFRLAAIHPDDVLSFISFPAMTAVQGSITDTDIVEFLGLTPGSVDGFRLGGDGDGAEHVGPSPEGAGDDGNADDSVRFDRAIMQSGNGNGAFTREQAATVTAAAAAAAARSLGVPADLERFSDLGDERLVTADHTVVGLDLSTATARDPLQKITPCSVVLAEHPTAVLARGAARSVDLLIGHNTEEGNLYLVPQGRLTGTGRAELQRSGRLRAPRSGETGGYLFGGASNCRPRAAAIDAARGGGVRSGQSTLRRRTCPN